MVRCVYTQPWPNPYWTHLAAALNFFNSDPLHNYPEGSLFLNAVSWVRLVKPNGEISTRYTLDFKRAEDCPERELNVLSLTGENIGTLTIEPYQSVSMRDLIPSDASWE